MISFEDSLNRDIIVTPNNFEEPIKTFKNYTSPPLPTLPLYIQQRILKYCWFDNSSTFKWKISLDLCCKKYFQYISNFYTQVNDPTLDPDNAFHRKLDTKWCPYKTPINLICSLDKLDKFIRFHKMESLLNITQNLKFIKILQYQQETPERFNEILTAIIENTPDLTDFRFKTHINADFKLIYEKLMEKTELEYFSLKIKSTNSKDLEKFLINKKIPRISLSFHQGTNLLLDNLPFHQMKFLNTLILKYGVINDVYSFFFNLTQLDNLKTIIIPSINHMDHCFNTPDSDRFLFREDFNLALQKYLKTRGNQMVQLDLPFPVGPGLVDQLALSTSLNILSASFSEMTKFSNSLTTIEIKNSTPLEVISKFANLNQDGNINKVSVHFVNDTVIPHLIEFVKNNHNLSSLNFCESIGDYIFPLLESLKDNKQLTTLSLKYTENSPTLENVNYIFELLKHNHSISYLKIYLFFYFYGFNASNIIPGNFSIVDCTDNYSLNLYRNVDYDPK
eukprot:gene4272-5345_t